MRAAIKVGFGLAFTLALSAAARADDDVAGKLAGNYKLVSGVHAGKAIPRDRLDGVALFTRDTITTLDKDNKEVYVIKYKIEGTDHPHKLMMTVSKSSRPNSEGLKAKGLIKVDGKTATLIYDYQRDEYPTGFETKGETQNLFVLERTGDK